MSNLAANQQRQSLVVGIDPIPASLSALCEQWNLNGDRLKVAEHWATLAIEAAGENGAAVKFQVAWFELMGSKGFELLAKLIGKAKHQELEVIADVKRGDVPHVAAAYAQAWLYDKSGSGLACDAMTSQAWLGSDVIGALMQSALKASMDASMDASKAPMSTTSKEATAKRIIVCATHFESAIGRLSNLVDAKSTG